MLRVLSLLLFFVFTHQTLLSQSNYPVEDFVPPLNIPMILSGTFGELRTNHFHSGIDIKTQGREGLPIIAIADGEVYRIKVSPYGYGNALYVRHYNGYSSVYGHLKKYNKVLQNYVKKQQYKKESFGIELFPARGSFKVKQGDTIAWSGNSGGSGGPHLHFEIRSTATEKIINPLFFYDIKDSRAPEMIDLQFYDFLDGDLLESSKYNLVKDKKGKYHLAGEGVIEVRGEPGFGLRTFDRLDGASNKNGVYKIKMCVNDDKYYQFKMETFAFSETRYINSHIDYGQKACCKRVVNKLFVEPNNRLSVYEGRGSMKLPKLPLDSLKTIQITVSDIKGNTSELEFKVKRVAAATSAQTVSSGFPVFRHSQTNFFKNDKVDIVLPEGALYKDVYFEYAEKSNCTGCYSSIHQFGAYEIPIHKYYNVKIKPDILFEGDKSKLAIASFKKGKRADFEGGKFENGYVVGRTRQLGDFAVVADTIPPKVKPINFSNGSKVSKMKTLKVRIGDNFSGIDTYYPTIDGKWVLMEYDAKNNLLILKLKEIELEQGEHELKLMVKDELNNKSTVSYRIIL
jgi:murein DD-endopeptidase MepM/ murein hydrolase activator NlpD